MKVLEWFGLVFKDRERGLIHSLILKRNTRNRTLTRKRLIRRARGDVD